MVIDQKNMCNVESIKLLNYFDGLCENPFDFALFFSIFFWTCCVSKFFYFKHRLLIQEVTIVWRISISNISQINIWQKPFIYTKLGISQRTTSYTHWKKPWDPCPELLPLNMKNSNPRNPLFLRERKEVKTCL